MKLVRSLSAVFFYLFKFIGICYLATALYALINCLFRGPFFEIIENDRFAINYPFSTKHFLLGTEFTVSYVAELVSGIAIYGIFFLMLSGVFNAFRQKRLFTHVGIKNLKRFYIFNLIIYPVLVILWSMISIEDFPFVAMIVAHAIMGIFIFFISAIFEQGVKLQTEQDLFI